MTLLQAWADSIVLLKPKNLKLFALVTLHSIIETYTLLFKYWWWLWLLQFIIVYKSKYVIFSKEGNFLPHFLVIWVCKVLLPMLVFFAVCVSTRPSVDQKNCAYFRLYGIYFLYGMLTVCLFTICSGGIDWLISSSGIFTRIADCIDNCMYAIHLPMHIIYLFLAPLLTFTWLFFLDSAPRIKTFLVAMYNALKMIIFNAPLYCTFNIFFYVATYMLFSIMSLFRLDSYDLFIKALLIPVLICTYANIYIKKLHDQFDLYFPRQQ